MTKKLCLLCGCMIVAAASGYGESVSTSVSTNRLFFPGTGFSIAPLEASVGQTPQQVLTLFLPAAEGYIPNVNVNLQPYTGSLEDYVALSLKEFRTARLKVIEHKVVGNSAVLEYSGYSQGRKLHWYAQAEKSAGTVYLVTAAAEDSQWRKVEARLKACVESFRFEGGAPAAAPAAAPASAAPQK